MARTRRDRSLGPEDDSLLGRTSETAFRVRARCVEADRRHLSIRSQLGLDQGTRFGQRRGAAGAQREAFKELACTHRLQ